MTPTILLYSALIGACTALILRFVFLLIQKQPRNTWFKPLLKTGLSGAMLGCVGGYVGYLTANWVSGFNQQWLVILLSACLAAFMVGWIWQNLLERLVWRRLSWE